MKIIKTILLLCSGILPVFPLSAQAVDVQFVSGNLSVNWVAGDQNTPAFSLALASNPGNIFSGTNIDGEYFVEDIDGVAPYGLVYASYNSNVSISNTFLRSGSLVNGSLTYSTGATEFLSSGLFLNSAQEGTDNFLGISFLDINSQVHYGWLQFELHGFTDGALAAQFLSGNVNDTQGTTATTGAVPEPSTVALFVAAGSGLVLLARSRRKLQS